jgi:hypothetical protein
MQAAPSRARWWGTGPLHRVKLSPTGHVALAPHPAFGHLLPASQGEGCIGGECGMSCIMKRVPRQRSFDGDALAAKLDEARASYNGTLVVAVAVHLDPDCRCCGADHACSVARGLERWRQRTQAARGELRAGSHGGVNARCPARESPTLGRRYRRTRGWNRTTGPARDPRRARPRAVSSPACCCRVRARTRHAREPAGPR